MKTFSVGIALSGGGARGFAHLGVIQALAEKGIYPEVFSGVSAGAIAGVFLADGFSPEETQKVLKENGFFNYTRIHLPTTGLLSLEGLRKILTEKLGDKDMRDLKHPLFAGVSNLTEGRVEFMQEGPLADVILASASIPVLFSPVEINGEQYVDGGLFDNLPVSPLKGKCKHLIAVNISPLKKSPELENLIQVAARTFHLSIGARIEDKKSQCDLFIEPRGLEEYNTLASGHADELFEIGYNWGKKQKIPWTDTGEDGDNE